MIGDTAISDVMDATVFVDGPVDLSGLVADLAALVNGSVDGCWVIADNVHLLVDENDEVDPARRAVRPNGFLYFSLFVEVYFPPSRPVGERARLVGRVLTHLWSRGIAAVAACDYEDALPHGGGAGDRSLPWPEPPRSSKQ
ncbi:MAG TPA: hypothetical protein VGP96_03865 [Candidatus Dormibacteraeota bacterium]|nr:hypothetical protein [Candidatus Dormibacteraeota bacterium]